MAAVIKAAFHPEACERWSRVVSFDSEWFGNYIIGDINCHFIKGDIRDIDSVPMDNVDAIIHLANIANDPAVDLNETLSWEVNVLANSA